MALQDKESIFEIDEEGEINSLTYNGSIDIDIINVLKQCATEDFFYTEISKTLSLDEKYVELILHYLAHLDFVDYGTSPRGSWITDLGRKFLALIEKQDQNEI